MGYWRLGETSGITSDNLNGTFPAWPPGSIVTIKIYNRGLAASEIIKNCNAQVARFSGASCAPWAPLPHVPSPKKLNALLNKCTNPLKLGGQGAFYAHIKISWIFVGTCRDV
jgi:hypothetical protein